MGVVVAPAAPTLTFLVSLEALAPAKNPDLHKCEHTPAACMVTDAISSSVFSGLRRNFAHGRQQPSCSTTNAQQKLAVAKLLAFFLFLYFRPPVSQGRPPPPQHQSAELADLLPYSPPYVFSVRPPPPTHPPATPPMAPRNLPVRSAFHWVVRGRGWPIETGEILSGSPLLKHVERYDLWLALLGHWCVEDLSRWRPAGWKFRTHFCSFISSTETEFHLSSESFSQTLL
jgi:hypothetical protein